MTELRLDDNKRGLIVVAHPDDETIWMGGTILTHPRVKWTIFSLCRASDRDRAPKFKRVCARYQARGIITDMDDEGRWNEKTSAPVVAGMLKEKLAGHRFDYIFTHGINGEYGHPLHIGVHTGVASLLKRRFLDPETVFYFNYKKLGGSSLGKLAARADSDRLIKLSRTVMAEKKRIVAEMYGYPSDGIDVGYCTNPEGYKVIDCNE